MDNGNARIQFVELTDYRGQTRRIDMAGVSTMLTGPNGSGKSSVLRAISLALTGKLPGSNTELDTKGYAEDTGPSGAFKIEVGFTDGGRVVREFTGTQMRVRANFGPNPTSPRNPDHEQALVERCGRNMSLFMDSNRIVNLPPDMLRNMVLRMCAESSPNTQWTAQMVADYLYGNVPGLKESGILAPLVQKHTSPGVVFEPLAFMDAIQNTLETEATECRRIVRELNLTLNAKAPIDRPDPEEIENCKNAIVDMEAELSSLQRSIGGTQEKIDAIKAGNAKIKADYEYSAKYITQAQEAFRNATATCEKYRAAIATAHEQLDALTLARPVEPVIESAPVDDLFGNAVEVVDDAPKYDGDIAADRALATKLDADGRTLATEQRDSAVAVMSVQGRIEAAQNRKAKFERGVCPECGQSVEAMVTDIDDELASLNAELAECEARREKANLAQTFVNIEWSNLVAKIRAYDDALIAYNATKKQREAAEANKGADYQVALSRWLSSVNAKQDEIDTLNASLNRFDAMLAEAEKTLRDATTKRIATTQVEVAQVPVELQEQLDGLLASEVDLVQRLDAARSILEELNGNVKTLDEFARKQFEAESRKQATQNRQSLVTDGLALLPKLLTMIVDALVGPLVLAVNAMLPPRLGIFTVRFNPTFSIGVERPIGNTDKAHFVPMSALSTAEKYVFLACIQKAIIDMQGASVPVVQLDNIEVMDKASWSAFLAFVRDSNPVMQIIVAGRRDDVPNSESAFAYSPLTA